jgi:hypothetical protein
MDHLDMLRLGTSVRSCVTTGGLGTELIIWFSYRILRTCPLRLSLVNLARSASATGSTIASNPNPSPDYRRAAHSR